MADDEYVETSDPEEREELCGQRIPHLDRDRQRSTYFPGDDFSRRKRIKLRHPDSAPSTPLRLSSLVNIQPDPSASSPSLGQNTLPSSTLKSSSLVQTPVHALYSDNIWTDDTDRLSQDPLMLLTHSNTKYEESDAMLDVPSSPPPPSYTDDELALGSRESYFFGLASPPLSSPSSERSRSFDPLSLLDESSPKPSQSPPMSPAYFPGSPLESNNQTQDPSESFLRRPTSPLTRPLSSEKNLVTSPDNTPPNITLSSPHTGRPIDQHPNEQNNEPSDPLSHNADIDIIPAISRYPLRRRALAQIKPYTVEKLQYKQALSANPDAIVNYRDPSRVTMEHYDHADDRTEESQALWRPDEDADGNESNKRQRQSRKTSLHQNWSKAHVGTPEEPVRYPEILRDLPSTDEEEARDFQDASREVRRLMRERKARENRERRERIQNLRKAKPFPLKEPVIPSTTEKTRGLRSLSLSLDGSKSMSPPSSRLDDIYTPVKTSPFVLSPSSSPVNEFDVARTHSRSPMQSPDGGHTLEARNHVQDKILSDTQMEVLGRMYPAFMLPDLAKDARPRKVRTKRAMSALSASGGSESDVLLPGQTRTRLSKTPGNHKDVKGDTESSDEERISDVDSIQDMAATRLPSEPDLGLWDSDGHSSPDVLELTDSSVEDSDDGVDDELIQAYLDDGIGSTKTTSRGYSREGNLINYMLARTRIVHDHQSSSKRKTASHDAAHKRDAKSSKPRNSVTTKRGRRHERQTRLSFDHHTGRKCSSHKGGDRHAASSFRRAPSDIEDHEPYDDRDRVDPVPKFQAPKKKSRKEIERERRARAKGNGLYTFASDNTHIVTGRREGGMMTVNIEDEGCRRRTASRSRDWALPFHPAYPASSVPKKPASRQLPSRSPHHRLDDDTAQTAAPEARLRSFTVDFNIPVLYSGISFGADTYIGKGWLSELISITRCEIAPPIPATIALQGIELGPSTSIDNFTKSLGRIFDALFDVITLGIEAANEKQEWCRVQRVATQLLSWLLAPATDPDAKFLRETVREQTSKFVSRIRGLSLQASSIDKFILSVAWFAIELCARLGLSFPLAASCVVRQSISLLVHHLLEYGFEQTMDPIVSGHALDGSTTAQYAAELWISLFHLADDQRDRSKPSKQIHPFLSIVKEALESRHTSSKSGLEASETIWRSIFSLCALSQFSVHGMTTGKSRLPTCWDLVVDALKGIRLVADDNTDGALPLYNLRKRDKYISLVTNRCFHLCSIWHWHFDNASDLFSQLSSIFRSRKFAGLRHERAEYPSFLVQNDWGSLSRHDRRDTAFVVYLKLIVQAAGCDETNPDRGLSPKAKKLLSLAIPVGSLPFSKKTPLIVQDLTMLYNRLSALAIAIYLNPTHHASRIAHARKYDDFADANDTTRIAVIRGMMYLAIMLKTAKLSMEGIKEWIETMASVLVNDFKGLQPSGTASMSQEERKIKRDRVSFCAHLLIGSVREIVKAYEANSEYPEPMLLSSLEPIFKSSQTLVDSPKIAEEIRQLVQTFLDARKSALPPPVRPRIVLQAAQESQESQDEYDTIDMDYDDPALLAMLSAGVGTMARLDFKEKEIVVKSSIDGRFVWWAWRNLNKWVAEPAPPSKDEPTRIDHWLDCWLGCADILIHADGKSWSQYLDLRKSWKISDRRKRRMDLSVMMRVLKLDPMTYVEYQDNYLEILMVALASPHPTLERVFIPQLLSIDGCQHPLLSGLLMDTTDATVDDYPKELELRDMIRVILCNLAGLLRQKAMGSGSAELDCEKYVGFCIKMLQAMQGNLSDLEAGSEIQQKYVDWCRVIMKMVHEHRELRLHPRLTFWTTWRQALG